MSGCRRHRIIDDEDSGVLGGLGFDHPVDIGLRVVRGELLHFMANLLDVVGGEHVGRLLNVLVGRFQELGLRVVGRETIKLAGLARPIDLAVRFDPLMIDKPLGAIAAEFWLRREGVNRKAENKHDRERQKPGPAVRRLRDITIDFRLKDSTQHLFLPVGWTSGMRRPEFGPN